MIKINDQIVMDGIFPNNEIWIKNNLIKNNSAVNFVELFYESDSDLIKLYMVKNELDRYGTKSILSIKYMPYSRMDREVCDYVYSLEYIAKFINDLKFEYVEIYDAHSPKTLELINN
jgi:ribose-phosphate pyrophosphokinase